MDSNHVNSSYGHFPVAKIEAMKLNSRLILFEATDRELLNISTRMTCTKCMIFIYVMKMLPRCSEKETKRSLTVMSLVQSHIVMSRQASELITRLPLCCFCKLCMSKYYTIEDSAGIFRALFVALLSQT